MVAARAAAAENSGRDSIAEITSVAGPGNEVREPIDSEQTVI